MSCVAGRLSHIDVSTDNGVTWVRVGKLVDATLNLNISELECTSHDSNGAREYDPSFHDATVDGSLRYLDFDAGQTIVATAAFAKTTFQCRLLPQDILNGQAFVSTSAFATKYAIGTNLNDPSAVNFTIRLSGLTRVLQPSAGNT